MSFAAEVTEWLRITSGISLFVQRNPVVLAKELAGIDCLSKGRLIFGVGVGWSVGPNLLVSEHDADTDCGRNPLSATDSWV